MDTDIIQREETFDDYFFNWSESNALEVRVINYFKFY